MNDTTTTTPTTPTLSLCLEMSRYAWERRERSSNPWKTARVAAFAKAMDRAGYTFDDCNYPIDGILCTRWDQLWAWAESIAQNERDTARGL